MKYIITGYKENNYKCYERLAFAVKGKIIKIDWDKSFNSQLIELKLNDIIIGFSLGAVLAKMSAQKYPCRLAILASMTPKPLTKKDRNKYIKYGLAPCIVKDITDFKHKRIPQIFLRGEHRDVKRGRIVKGCIHRMSDRYIKAIQKLV